MVGLTVACFGVLAGSFLNVCIHRMPQGLSVVLPGSRCPQCENKIAWHDNVPILSFLLLRGRCRRCQGRISWRYPAVELTSGVLWGWLWYVFGWTWGLSTGLFLFSILLAVLVSDLETGLIPDALSMPGMAGGFVFSAFYPGLHGVNVWSASLKEAALGFAAGFGVLLLTGIIGKLLFKKDSMGMGDMKLLAMLGAFLGWQKVILVFFASPFLALPTALYARFVNRSETIPFGPYLAVAGGVMFVYGDRIAPLFF